MNNRIKEEAKKEIQQPQEESKVGEDRISGTIADNNLTQQEQSSKQNKSARILFPRRLHEMLDDVERNDNQHVVGWEPDGLSFKVYRPKEFEATIMPKFFNHKNFRSFTRQLYNYSFSRIPAGPSKGAYFHPQFTKHDKTRCPDSIKKDRSPNAKMSPNEADSYNALIPGMSPSNLQTNAYQYLLTSNEAAFLPNPNQRPPPLLPMTNEAKSISANSNIDNTQLQQQQMIMPQSVQHHLARLNQGSVPLGPLHTSFSHPKKTSLTPAKINAEMRRTILDVRHEAQHDNSDIKEAPTNLLLHTSPPNFTESNPAQIPIASQGGMSGNHQHVHDSSLFNPFLTSLSSDMEPTPLPEPNQKDSKDLKKPW